MSSMDSASSLDKPSIMSVSSDGIDIVIVLDSSIGMSRPYPSILKRYLEPLVLNNTYNDTTRWSVILSGNYFPSSKMTTVLNIFTQNSQNLLAHLSNLSFQNGNPLKNAHHESLATAIQFLDKIKIAGRQQHCIFITSTLSHLHGTRLASMDLLGLDIYQLVSRLTMNGTSFSFILCRKSMTSLQILEKHVANQSLKPCSTSDSEYARLSPSLVFPQSSTSREGDILVNPLEFGSSLIDVEKKRTPPSGDPVEDTNGSHIGMKRPKIDPGTPFSAASPPPAIPAETKQTANKSKKPKKENPSPKKVDKANSHNNSGASPVASSNISTETYDHLDLQKSVQSNQQSLLALHAQINQQNQPTANQARPQLTSAQQQLLQRLQQQQAKQASQDMTNSSSPQLMGNASSPVVPANRPATMSPSVIPGQLNPQLQAVLKAQQLLSTQQQQNNFLWSGHLSWTGNDPISKQTTELVCNVTAVFPPSRVSAAEDLRQVHWPTKLQLSKTIPFKDELFNRLLTNQSLPIVQFNPINQANHVTLYRTLLMNLGQNTTQTTLAAVIYFPASPPFNGQQVVPQIENAMRTNNANLTVTQQPVKQPQSSANTHQIAQQVQQLVQSQQNQQQNRQIQQQQLMTAVLNNPALISQFGAANIQSLMGQHSVLPQMNLQSNVQQQQQQQNNALAALNLTPQQLAALQQQLMRPPNM